MPVERDQPVRLFALVPKFVVDVEPALHALYPPSGRPGDRSPHHD
jgi:hypothetical protein